MPSDLDDVPARHRDLEIEHRLFLEGIARFNTGDFFEAHEIWEEVWKLTLDKRRERFYRGLTQSAVTLELLRRGRAIGVRQVFVSCLELFNGLPDTFMGVELPDYKAKLRHAIQPALDDLETRHIQIDPLRLFQIELAYDPFMNSQNGENASDTA